MQRHLRAARAVLWTEALLVGLWPAASLLAAAAGLALLDVPQNLPWPIHTALLVAVLAGLVLLLRRATPRLRLPGQAAAEHRLERDSGLAHRPFATLRDAPATTGTDDPLWARHQARARASLSGLRLELPNPDLPRHDRLAWRAAALLLLTAGLVVAGPHAGNRLRAALLPGLPGLRAGVPPVVQAWIQPPAYTGLPPVFLAPGGSVAPATVPIGSRLTLSVTGVSAAPRLSLGDRTVPLEQLGQDSYQAGLALDRGGQLRLGGRFSALALWTLALIPNEPPTAAWPAPPGRAGTSQSIRLPWQVAQRWGVARLEAEFFPTGHPELPARHIPLPLPGTPRQASGSAIQDLSADPYAGVQMTGHLKAQDVSGQRGQSSAAEFVLPARIFHHPLARAIAELRRRLALHPEARAEAAGELSALAEAPVGTPVPGLPASGVALNLAAAASLLNSPADHAVEVQARLWELALALDGALPDASTRALAEARDNLRRGIEDHARGKMSDKELAQRLDALRQALDKRLADLAARAMKQGALQKFDPHTQHLSAPAVDRLVKKLEQALRDGKAAEARQAMAQLERMMDQLKDAHIMSPEEARQQQEQARTGRQQMGAVQDMVQREGALLDHAQTRTPGSPPNAPLLSDQLGQLTQPPPDGTDDPGQAPGQDPLAPPPPAPDSGLAAAPKAPQPGNRQQDARVQKAMRRALDALKDGLAQAGRKKPASLDDADRAMQDAAGALANADDPQARDAIARAIAALQQGGQDMAKQGSQQSGGGMQLSLQPGGQPGQEGEEGQEGSGDGQGGEGHGQKRDPFGRPVDANGMTADDPGLRVPDQMEQGRSRAIQEELRRRGADRGRSKGELDYIGRLLKPF